MQKFVLTGMPRTGTTVLSGALLHHPDVLFYGELFHHNIKVRAGEAARRTLGAGWKLDPPPGQGIKCCPPQMPAAAYLKALFGQPTLQRALGFKLLSDQATRGSNSDVWDCLVADQQVKFIETRRRHLLPVICSFVRASMTRCWHTNKAPEAAVTFVITADEFVRLADRFQYRHPALARLASQRRLVIDYEAIESDFSGCMARLFRFLGVTVPDRVQPALKKIATLSPEQELRNYRELKLQFEGSAYGRIFEDWEGR
ncbi:MAG: sulfotransferase [Candidatus Pelagadaptatus aseana]|uniref:hypothetical protein n=1 Tax=Candidatus Pelagadaptatus aseana TaxID=3120508 RepID=UPI0039B35935